MISRVYSNFMDLIAEVCTMFGAWTYIASFLYMLQSNMCNAWFFMVSSIIFIALAGIVLDNKNY